MKKLTIGIAIGCLAMASGALADEVKRDPGPPAEPRAGGLLDCTGATLTSCGDVRTGTVGTGGNVDDTYGCTTLSYLGCDEVVYEILRRWRHGPHRGHDLHSHDSQRSRPLPSREL